MVDLVYSPTFHNHPDLKVAYSEGGIAWFPFALQRVDQVWEHYRYYDYENNIRVDVRPSELIHKHIWGCFIDDQFGLECRHVIGVDHLLFESDYPHADSLWPHSRDNAKRLMENIPDDEAFLIAEGNARQLFRFQ
jgi:predicted TIM-barrel fold metal-dependent hydrolase